MTRDEAIHKLKYLFFNAKALPNTDEALSMAIEALEKEPCDDAISRQAVLEITAETGALETQARVKALPPVTPQQKETKND
jgi:hypothetical protein